ncbi:DUF2259 domain-containing protein [Methylocapsa sp. S129]|uniref:DUF2259 domain-containing protein n=1 Tax=Methylocapsa sp. S129 TaxID=1641869 RepID=UPI00131C0DE2|nr:DUF2259 domain-containing protein [Methylocapsa sp. S129]
MIQRTLFILSILGPLLAVFAGAAQAGDAAARRIIGFSPDGAHFAFEQYGVLDGKDTQSGWSEIAIIDTQTDEIVDGKPILVVGEGKGEPSLRQARAQAASKAAPLLAKYSVRWPGKRTDADRFTLPDTMIAAKDIGAVETASERLLNHFQVEQILADSAKDCAASLDSAPPGDRKGKALGFRLTLETPDGAPLKVLHEDKSVPEARDCPTSYSLSEAYEFRPQGKPAVAAVLVQRFSQGHEGRDRRFIAVTGQMP